MKDEYKYAKLSACIDNKLFEDLQQSYNRVISIIESCKTYQVPIFESYKKFEDIIAGCNIPNINIPAWDELYKQFACISEQWRKVFNYYTNQLPKDLRILAQYGWYCEIEKWEDIPSFKIHAIAAEYADGRIHEAEDIMFNYYQKNVSQIIAVLSDRHSNRRMILNEIQTTYNHKCYYAAITLLLSQVDGICKDKTNQLFFIRNKHTYLPKIVDSLQNESYKYLMSPILELSPIFIDRNFLSNFPCKLNRHNILHGEDIDYGNETNFLKCLSLLKYISDLLVLFE